MMPKKVQAINVSKEKAIYLFLYLFIYLFIYLFLIFRCQSTLYIIQKETWSGFFSSVAYEKYLFHNAKREGKQIKWLIGLDVLLSV